MPVTTTLAGFAEAVKGIEAVRGEGTGLAPLSLQEWQTIGSGRVERWKRRVREWVSVGVREVEEWKGGKVRE